MEDKKSERKPFLFKRSIAVRILLTVFIILVVTMIAAQEYLGNVVTDYVEKYYIDIGELLSTITASELELFPGDIREFGYSDNADQLKEICREYDVSALWVITSEPPYKTGVCQVMIDPNILFSKEEIEELWDSTFELDERERMIFSGKERSANNKYDDPETGRMLYFLHGIYDSDGSCKAVIGVDFDEDRILDEMRNDSIKLGWIIALIFTVLLMIIGVLFHVSVFAPLKRISEKMRNYTGGSQLDEYKLPVKGEDELSRVAASFNKMSEEINDYIEKVSTLEKERLTSEAEMNVAAQIQAGMLPSSAYIGSQIRINAVMKPAKEIGGDFYDYLTLPDGRIFLVMADVSGKGVSAALFMAEAMNAIRYNAALYLSPAQLLRAANNDLCARNPEMMFVTAFAAIYDPRTAMLTYSNAGHNPAYIICAEKTECLKDADCLFLGMFPDEEYIDAEKNISPGNILFMYTDGLTETVDPDKAMYGKERMEKELREYAGSDKSADLTEKLFTSASAFARGAEVHDDLTMMEAHFGKELILSSSTDENMTLRNFLMSEEGLSESEKKKICLAAEEIFVNICHYAYDGREAGSVRICTLLTDDCYSLRFSDSGIPYDPLKDQASDDEYDPDIRIGGLGKLMAFTIMEEQEYEYRDGFNILTLRRFLKHREDENDNNED